LGLEIVLNFICINFNWVVLRLTTHIVRKNIVFLRFYSTILIWRVVLRYFVEFESHILYMILQSYDFMVKISILTILSVSMSIQVMTW